MPRINADIPEEINKKLKLHALRYDFKLLPDALVDVLRRFFSKEDYDYFLDKNQEKEFFDNQENKNA